MKAYLKNYRQSPRKVRLVAHAVKGTSIPRARMFLDAMAKRAALPLKKLLDSAVANARQTGVQEENLIVKEFTVDKGVTMHRSMPRARGTVAPINKRTSNVHIVLEELKEKKNLDKKTQPVSGARGGSWRRNKKEAKEAKE